MHITYNAYHKTVKSENYSEIHDFFFFKICLQYPGIYMFYLFIFLQLRFWHKGLVVPWHVESFWTKD